MPFLKNGFQSWIAGWYWSCNPFRQGPWLWALGKSVQSKAAFSGSALFKRTWRYGLWGSSGKANATTTNFNTLSVQIKDLESRMNANAELQKQIVNYAKTRAVYVEYRKAGYSKNSEQHMRLKFCCIRRQRIILTSWESKSSPLSNLSGRNTPTFWNKTESLFCL